MRHLLGHDPETPTQTAGTEFLAPREEPGKAPLRRCILRAQVDTGRHQGETSRERARIQKLTAEVRRLEEDHQIRDLAWTMDDEREQRMTPEGLCGFTRVTGVVPWTGPETSTGAMSPAMRSLSDTP